MKNNYIKYGEIGCWLTDTLGEMHVFYFRPELVEVGVGEMLLCRDTYHEIGAIVSVKHLRSYPDLLHYLTSITPDNKLDIQVAFNKAYAPGAILSAITANGYADTGLVTDTLGLVVEPMESFSKSLMQMYTERVEGAVEFVLPPIRKDKNPYVNEHYMVTLPPEYLEEMFGTSLEEAVDNYDLKVFGGDFNDLMNRNYPELYHQFVISRLQRYKEMWQD